MHTRRVVFVGVALAAVVVSCSFPGSKGPDTCETNIELCPKSSKAATSVTCDCKCTVGTDEDTGDNYTGRVAVCLPNELNGMLAAGEVRSALTTLDDRSFDQQVYSYCSQDVARFLRTTIKAPIGLRACAIPLHCECTTKGALRDSVACHSGCTDADCTKANCPAVLWRHGKLDASWCHCSRSSACGNMAPLSDHPALCRDWLTPVSDPADASTDSAAVPE